MDRNYLGMIAAITFLLLIITLTIKVQMGAVENAADYSEDNVAAELRTQGAILHIMNNEKTMEFGKYNQSGLQDALSNCGKTQYLKGISDDTFLRVQTGPAACSAQLLRTSTIIGLEHKDGGDTDSIPARVTWSFASR